MRRFLWLGAALSVLPLAACRACSGSTPAPSSDDYVVGAAECSTLGPWSVSSAVRQDGEIWLLDSSARLWSLSLSTDTLTRRRPDDAAHGLIVIGNRLVVLGAREGAARLWTREGGTWTAGAEIRGADEPLELVASPSGDEVLVLGRTKAWIARGPRFDTPREFEIRPALPQTTAPRAPVWTGSLVYAVVRGEERSSLFALDVHTGLWRRVERRDDATPCAGPLNADCDVIRSTIADPARAGCVLVALGRPARDTAESLLRVCDDLVSTVLAGGAHPRFDRLVRVGSEICATGDHALHCIAAASSRKVVDLGSPARDVCGLPIRPLDGLVALGQPPVIVPP